MAQKVIDPSLGWEYDGSGSGVTVDQSNAQATSDNFDELYGVSGPLADAVTAAEAAQTAAETAETNAETAQAAAEAAQAAAEALAVSTKTNAGVGDQVTMSDTAAHAHSEKTSVGAALMAADDILVIDYSEWVDSVDSTPQFTVECLVGTTAVDTQVIATAAANDYCGAHIEIKCTAVGASLTGEVTAWQVKKDGTVAVTAVIQKALAITASSTAGFDITVQNTSNAGHANNKSTLRTISHYIRRATA